MGNIIKATHQIQLSLCIINRWTSLQIINLQNNKADLRQQIDLLGEKQISNNLKCVRKRNQNVAEQYREKRGWTVREKNQRKLSTPQKQQSHLQSAKLYTLQYFLKTEKTSSSSTTTSACFLIRVNH